MWILAGTAALTVAAGASIGVILWPATERPGRVDAVVVLSGDRGDRIATALRLLDEGVAEILVHAGAPDSVQVLDLCAGEAEFEVVCLEPDPDNTRSEAQAVARLAESRGWSSIAVVTSSFHVTRSGILFRRCYDGTVHMVDSRPRPAIRDRQVVRELAALLHLAVVDRGC